MYPREHIILGFVLSMVLFLFNLLTFFQGILFFFASTLIDFDHYIDYIRIKKDLSLKNAYVFFKNIKLKKLKKKHFPVLHSVEFTFLILILSIFYSFLFYVFLGMIFHELCDLYDGSVHHCLKTREYSFINYLIHDKSNYI